MNEQFERLPGLTWKTTRKWLKPLEGSEPSCQRKAKDTQYCALRRVSFTPPRLHAHLSADIRFE